MIDQVAEQQTQEELFEDLIESAYLAEMIDGEQLALAYLWLANNHQGTQ